MRKATVNRKTKESQVMVSINLDGTGQIDISTGEPFFDHMLSQLGKHASFDLEVKTIGDIEVDSHHSVEDTSLALGQAFKEALGDKIGIRRFGDAMVPLDEVLVQAAVDLSGRPYLVHHEPDIVELKVGHNQVLFCLQQFFLGCNVDRNLMKPDRLAKH
jgi:imidazoleglycerol-phosphate dehydratase